MNSLRFGFLFFLVNTAAVFAHVPMPGYEEAKRRANAGLVEPTTKDIVKLSEDIGELEGPIFGGSFLGDTQVTAFPPDLTLAAGHNHLVAATNQGVQVFDKEGTRLNDWDLRGFFNRDGVTRCRYTDTVSRPLAPTKRLAQTLLESHSSSVVVPRGSTASIRRHV